MSKVAIQEHEIEGVGNIKHIKQSVLPFMMHSNQDLMRQDFDVF